MTVYIEAGRHPYKVMLASSAHLLLTMHQYACREPICSQELSAMGEEEHCAKRIRQKLAYFTQMGLLHTAEPYGSACSGYPGRKRTYYAFTIHQANHQYVEWIREIEDILPATYRSQVLDLLAQITLPGEIRPLADTARLLGYTSSPYRSTAVLQRRAPMIFTEDQKSSTGEISYGLSSLGWQLKHLLEETTQWSQSRIPA